MTSFGETEVRPKRTIQRATSTDQEGMMQSGAHGQDRRHCCNGRRRVGLGTRDHWYPGGTLNMTVVPGPLDESVLFAGSF
jgi:hypothetical protein